MEILTWKLIVIAFLAAFLLVWITDYIEHLFPYKEGTIVGLDHNVLTKFNSHAYIMYVRYDKGTHCKIKKIKVTHNVFKSHKIGDKVIVK